MSDFNRVYLIGNLAADPEIKDIGSSNKVTNFAVATNRSWTGPQGEEAKEVSFIDCTAYSKRAEVIEKYFSKGRKIFIEGRLKQEKWTDKETKKMQSRIRVIVENFHFMDKKEKDPAADIIATTSGNIPTSAGGDDMPIVEADDFDVL